MGEEAHDDESLPRAAKDSLIESFSIEGLYGYRTISISSEHAATIIIARNGSGKTTLIAALHAFLRCHFLRLREVQFQAIRCRLRGVRDELVLNSSDIHSLSDVSEHADLVRAARRFDIEPIDLLNFLERHSASEMDQIEELDEHPIFSSILRDNGYIKREAVAACERLRQSYYEQVPALNDIRKIITEVFANIDLVYLPTYRRIELPLNDKDTKNPRTRPPHFLRKRSRFSIDNTGLFTGDVHFGLSDIADRLAQLNQRLLFDSSISYREISANIINELLDGTFQRSEGADRTIPDRDELNLFFSRIKAGRRRIGPFDVTIPNIDRIYSGEGIPDESNRFLNYFLTKLNAAIQATRDIEVMVEDFINICNKYLSRTDPSATPNALGATDSIDPDPDGKLLRLNRRDLSVHVESTALRRPISLDALSSGEKQMISLFAKLFLYGREKVILIDEPELSLSIDWQRHLLVDLMNAPRCRQIIAITHSPFVFDNEFEPYARSMTTEINLNAVPVGELDEESDIDE